MTGDLLKTGEETKKPIRKRFLSLSFTRTIALGYLVLVIIGTFLLMLPVSSKDHMATPFFDALTTAVSSSCVTGLIVYDTYTHWSLFGQAILLFLIQTGGLGYMTIITFCSLVLKRHIGLRERGLLKESTNSLYNGGLIALTKKIVVGTIIFEFSGAVLLSIAFIPVFGFFKGIYFSIFHSVSAFCNAGFDLMGAIKPYGSLTYFRFNPLVLLTISFLIIIGGVGFSVWDDFTKHKFKFRSYSLHSKIAVATSGVLILSGFLGSLIFEWKGELSDMSFLNKLLNAFFCSVTARTAGFNTIDYSKVTPCMSLMNVFLMIVGGSPGSTAGGLKTTTLAVLFLSTAANVKNSKHINVYGRRIETDAVKKSLTVTVIYFAFWFLSSLLTGVFNPELTLSEIMFEAASAIGTVGISSGAMAKVNIFGQLILTVLMYSGRVGSMSFAMIFTESKNAKAVMFPEEKIIIG